RRLYRELQPPHLRLYRQQPHHQQPRHRKQQHPHLRPHQEQLYYQQL
ncbi:unnamed protein product, partial [Rotaria sp. Silwood2]